ncbi:MAG: 4a-hydroxytetrahydrobiopterin dehydratase [Nanoarchaeota archaeon]
MELLPIAQINENLGRISGWNLEDNGKSIIKHLEFQNFKEAVDFINKVAEIAERENHHPEIKLYNCSNLQIKLTTLSAQGLTKKDFDVAFEIDKI